MRPGTLSYEEAVARGAAYLARIDAAMDVLYEYEEARIDWRGQARSEHVYADGPDEPLPLGACERPDLQEEATAAIEAFDAEAVEIVRALLLALERATA